MNGGFLLDVVVELIYIDDVCLLNS
jgi:hypothetical protein